ncbi:helix-turn-helix transcriptional regulator [Sphingomonas sanguinis]|uniref:DeoR faimly transcriptional regulator n=1 Tax=Sphingomonas sanguinis TaxID=33051 RepID=A0A147JBX9_9SPHN|nr:WYL domain-containing protein [Sphingomonas sanguinis]KTW16574.1 DeoR faimly transcriptional regulator [Sphingomonas sanguinis]
MIRRSELQGSVPISADTLAEMLGVSVRTIYRDMVTLQAMGAPVRGEPGVGYQLEQSYFLPPLHLDHDEMDSVMLGMRLIAARSDEPLAAAAWRASAKFAASMMLGREATYSNLPLRAVSKPTSESEGAKAHLPLLRDAIRRRLILRITYIDLSDTESERTIRPLGLTLFDSAWLLTCWCEARNAFRNFRADRIATVSSTGATFRHEKGRRFEDYLKTL